MFIPSVREKLLFDAHVSVITISPIKKIISLTNQYFINIYVFINSFKLMWESTMYQIPNCWLHQVPRWSQRISPLPKWIQTTKLIIALGYILCQVKYWESWEYIIMVTYLFLNSLQKYGIYTLGQIWSARGFCSLLISFDLVFFLSTE